MMLAKIPLKSLTIRGGALWDKKPYRAYRMVTELTECLQEKFKSLQTLQNAYRKKVKKSPCKLPVRFKISL